MKPRQSSATARNNAILRAHETMRPANERMLYDPYAALFLPDRLQPVAERRRQLDEIVAGWERRYPGVCAAVLVRTRFVDDCVKTALHDGFRQLVILGAGYDTRALRLAALQADVTVFELDHPATQAIKRLRTGPTASPHVRYVPIDFTVDALDETLLAGGYDPDSGTLFVWEGVTYYLPAEAIDRTLDVVCRCSATGSRIVFDVFPPSVAGGASPLPEAKVLRDGLARIGESIVFGIAPDRIDRFMAARGFERVVWIFADDWAHARLPGANANRVVSRMFIFVQASVA